MTCAIGISLPPLSSNQALELGSLPSTKFTSPPARLTTDITEFWIKAVTDATLWKRVSTMALMVERMEEMSEERESVRPAMVRFCMGV